MLHSLKKEWDKKLPLISSRKVDTIYFGGGTPTLSPEIITTFLSWATKDLQLSSNIEITVEANPETITDKILFALQNAGVNRMSIGVQSFHENALQILGRNHDSEKALFAVELASKYIKNLSIDLMFDLPFETSDSLQASLSPLSSLPISHISLYNLTIDPHTSFYKKRENLPQPTAERSIKHMEYIFSQLQKSGFRRYEISAFCKNNMLSRHNCKYWKDEEVMGFGPSATSYFQKKRSKSFPNIMRYATKLENNHSFYEYEEILPEDKAKRLKHCLGLRLMEGILLPPNDPIWNEFSFLMDKGLIEKKGNRAQLTARGVYFHDLVCEEII